MMKIRLATVFSGIGAIEHALDRMGVPHEIVFACDNGDVDIFSKEIPLDLDVVADELKSLRERVSALHFNDDVKELYKKQLDNMLGATDRELGKIRSRLGSAFLLDGTESLKAFTVKVLMEGDMSASRKKKLKLSFLALDKGSRLQRRFAFLSLVLDLLSYCRDNARFPLPIGLSSVYDGYDGYNVVRSLLDISQRVGQLYEKINTLEIQLRLEGMGDDWDARKKYVDGLYGKVWDRNMVMRSYTANYDIDPKDFHWNICFLDGKQYEGQVDLFVGGSPCQSFSMMGKQRGLEDTRGTLFYEFARLVKEVRPKVFIYENVRSVLYHDKGNTWKVMKGVFDDIGYSYSYEILNSKDYGIPQNRHRLFVVGFRKDIVLERPFVFPPKMPLDRKMQDFLVSNAPGRYFLPEKGVRFVTKDSNLSKSITQIDGDVQLCQKKNQQFNWKGDFVFQSEKDAEREGIPDLEKYFLSAKTLKQVMLGGTKSYYTKPETDLPVARALMKTMHKMHRAGVDNYVTTAGRLRRLTPRECLRLMGFSDAFRIVVSDTAMYQQAGNSIVVDVLVNIMGKILESYPALGENGED